MSSLNCHTYGTPCTFGGVYINTMKTTEDYKFTCKQREASCCLIKSLLKIQIKIQSRLPCINIRRPRLFIYSLYISICRVFVPDLVLNLTLSDIPDTLILPVQGGVGVHLHCNNDDIGKSYAFSGTKNKVPHSYPRQYPS